MSPQDWRQLGSCSRCALQPCRDQPCLTGHQTKKDRQTDRHRETNTEEAKKELAQGDTGRAPRNRPAAREKASMWRGSPPQALGAPRRLWAELWVCQPLLSPARRGKRLKPCLPGKRSHTVLTACQTASQGESGAEVAMMGWTTSEQSCPVTPHFSLFNRSWGSLEPFSSFLFPAWPHLPGLSLLHGYGLFNWPNEGRWQKLTC